MILRHSNLLKGKLHYPFCIIILFVFCSQISFAQGIRDSVFNIKTVDVKTDHLFVKEEAGMTITKVDSMVFMEKANASLSELLSQNTSVFIKDYGRGALATASFRGTAPSHTQVKWNGININNPMTGMVDFSLIPVYVLDEMSLKHGSASISEQSGGLGGLINIGNKANWSKPFALKYMQAIGSYSTYDEYLKVTYGTNNVQFKTSIYHNASRNNYTFINMRKEDINPETGEKTRPTEKNEHADYTKYGMMQEVYWKVNTKNIFTLKYWGQKADRTIPRVLDYEGDESANLNNQDDEDHKIVSDWKYYGGKSQVKVQLGYVSKDLSYISKNNIVGWGIRNTIDSRSHATNYMANFAYSYTSNKQYKSAFKLDYIHTDVDTKEAVKNTGYIEQRNHISLFYSISKSFNKRLNINLMSRQEIIDGQLKPNIPYAGFDYKLTPQGHWVAKGSIARNYHTPTLNDMYWQPGGNPALKPEFGFSSDLGIESVIGNENMQLKTDITAFYADINDWIIWLPTFKGYWTPLNIKKVISKGIESRIDYHGTSGKLDYRVVLGYAYTRSKNLGEKKKWGDNSGGKQLVYVPLHSANIIASLNYNKYFALYQWNSYSERHTTTSNTTNLRDELYPYFMNNLTLGKNINFKKIKLTAKFKISNVLGEQHRTILFRYMPGRNYLLTLMIKI